MKKILLIRVLIISIILLFPLLITSKVFAVPKCAICSINPPTYTEGSLQDITISLGDSLDPNHEYGIWVFGFSKPSCANRPSSNQISCTLKYGSDPNLWFEVGSEPTKQVYLTNNKNGISSDALCGCSYQVIKDRVCSITANKSNYSAGEKIFIDGTDGSLKNKSTFIKLSEVGGSRSQKSCVHADSTGKFSTSFTAVELNSSWTVQVKEDPGGCSETGLPFDCSTNITMNSDASHPPSTSTPSSDSCGGATGDALTSCKSCLGDKFEKTGSKSWTALGCIPTTFDGTSTDTNLIMWILMNLAIPTGGGVAFLIMLWGVLTMITSSGNPEKLNNGKEIITSALAGLVMILFSVFLLKLIGVSILGIPGFN